ncbi:MULTISPECIES: DoxX family protein [Rhizobium]|uniref:DoxX family protein n=1 Tax=Rhizobium tropici TaxID=398 RepID=A0A329YFF2_RHITR|nr:MULTISPECIES: DoxX family protein [Rhizobium]MBB3287766.1 putative membrane protein YphA (DoxX/SURF4 family) [Rhizobium sp. BK252]MBB3402630.1 putative membrane protein YphA (DoxX/SURF4 family) [Rhizobium sp. BK289]MBB3415206.1 putative membrane protein YphA (DoxX/SURF4 family) [Rhizobium sp. BK284]MBB3483095.1 putative membrane protein YphA (DoxX/SURF4 family) [Rhizobium sp. BK347]MDK4720719.1 DoxX family protein [Rhizobium sp. CNPSo 3968]
MSYVADSSLPSVTRAQRVAGMILSGLVVAFLLFDGVIKLVPLPVVTETMAGLGYSADPALAQLLGIITLGCAILYAIPRTSVLGAILLTGLLGGAIATHLRVGSPIFSHLLFGVYLGVMAWGGLYLRYEAVRKMIPFFDRSF